MSVKYITTIAIRRVLFIGYYTRISEIRDIEKSVLHYIEVMARPMVMYQNDHPIQWTPVFVGGKV